MRTVDITEYANETIIEIKSSFGRYQFTFKSWDEAIEALTNLKEI